MVLRNGHRTESTGKFADEELSRLKVNQQDAQATTMVMRMDALFLIDGEARKQA